MVLVRELNWLFLLVVAVDELFSLLRLTDVAMGSPAETGRAGGSESSSGRSAGYLIFALTVVTLVAPQFSSTGR